MTTNDNRTGMPKSRHRGRTREAGGGDVSLRSPFIGQDVSQRLFEVAQVIVTVLDTEARIVRVNPYMEELCGFRIEEVRGRDWFATFVPPHERDRMQALLSRCLGGETIDGFMGTLVTRNGVVRAIEWRASPLENGAGGVAGVLSVGKDITQRVQAERELYELNKVSQQRERLADMGAIAAQIVHDVGNPLAALSMQAQLIRRRAREDPEQPVGTVLKSAEQIVVELRRLESLVREFMNFARVQRLDLRFFKVKDFLTNVVALWSPVAFARGIDLTVDGTCGSLRLRADQEKLHRVLDNLVKNAVEAIGDGPGLIAVGASVCAPGRIRISVRDTGPGIAKNVSVFRLFESTKTDGSGLGLSVARQIVLAHGGSIYFDPVTPHGAVFHIELPMEGPAAG